MFVFRCSENMLDNDHSIGPIKDITNNVVHMKSWKYIYIYIFVCVCIYIHIYLCVCVYIYTFKQKENRKNDKCSI